MSQENNNQNQETAPKNADSNAEKNSQITGTQNSQSQMTGSAAAVKKYDETEQSGGVIKEFYDKAKQSAGQVTEKATEKLDEKKTVVTEGLAGVADSIRQVGENLRETGGGEENPIAQFTGKYGDALANQVEQVSNYFDSKNVREIVRDVESFARRNPAIFIGGAFALGILAARFLKSSSPKNSTRSEGQSFSAAQSEGYTNGESENVSSPS